MRKDFICAVAVLALASCSSDSMVGDSPVNNEAPIAFTVGQRNITRAETGDPLESKGYNDFGVWAYKVKSGETPASALVMGNYKVAYQAASGENPAAWNYAGVLVGQSLRYWDYSYDQTDFYAYAPYNADATISDKKITVSSTAGYEKTNDVIYAGTTVEKANYNNKVALQFKHIGAKVNVAFRENVAGYKVELIKVSTDNGIELTPAIYDEGAATDKYTKGSYSTTSSVVINYTTPTAPTTSATATATSGDNLKFALPTTTELSESDYVVSPTTYYAVVQPESTTGFTLHISYKLIAEDNGEEITVKDARVFIPANQVKWESNKAYTYNFTITTSSTGSTGGTVDVDSPVVPTDKALLPIVFDEPTIVDYEAATPSEKNI